MKVVMVSDSEINGGAAVAASCLAEGLCQFGHRVTRLVNNAEGQNHSWHTVPFTHSIPHKALRRVLPSMQKVHWERQAAARWLNKHLALLEPDAINLHNIHSAGWAGWSEEMVCICAQYAPVIWTLHDMWSFTGRCAYSYDCRKFLTGCDATCPTADEYPALAPAQIGLSWESKARILSLPHNVVAVTPSQWLAYEAKSGMWSSQRVEVIPYGISLNTYKPMSQSEALTELGINAKGPVLLIAANDFSERRKGGPLFVEALTQVAQKPLTLITMGSGALNIKRDNIEVYALGYITEARKKRLAYCAADIFVHPALVDNLPNTILESLGCGTPVVGFAIGGVPDMVRPGLTGWLSNMLTPEGLAGVLNRAFSELAQGLDLRHSCRFVAEEEYDAGRQAHNYSDLFADLIAKRNQTVLASTI